MMPMLRQALLLALLLFLSSCEDNSDVSWAMVQEAGTLKIGVMGTYAPMSFYDPVQDRESGFDVELAREACRRLGIQPVFHRIFWLEKFIALEERRIDCIWSSMSITPDRADQVLFSEPYLYNRQVVVVLDSSAIQELNDLKGHALVVLSGSSAIDVIKKTPQLGSSVSLETQTQTVLALMRLLDGEASALVADEVLVGKYVELSEGSSQPLRVLPAHLGAEGLGVAFRKGEWALRNRVQRVLNQMENDGTTAELRKHWLNSKGLAKHGLDEITNEEKQNEN